MKVIVLMVSGTPEKEQLVEQCKQFLKEIEDGTIQ